MIEVNDLTYEYDKNKQALCEISFSVKKGEVFGFLGPNGSGKSTTQKILTGLLKDYSGKVNVMGKSVIKWNETFYNDIGVLFEFPYLYSTLSALDNLKYFSSFYPKQKREDIFTLLKRVELKEGFAKKNVTSYSKGMKQRVSMARALINNPSLLFLDEPTSGLDPAGAVLFRNIVMEEKKRGTTIFLTTHNMFDADILCDRVAFLSDGNIKVIDTPSNLKKGNIDQKVKIEYSYEDKVLEKIIDSTEIKNGLPFSCDRIISIHSVEPTLEDVFIKCTGKELKL